MWERWNSYTRDHGFGDVSMNSFNHYAYGAIGQWMYERVAGIASDPAHPGYKHFFVRPLVKGPLSSARAEVETPYGKAVSSWEKRNGKVTLMVTIPPNTTATVDLRGLGAPRTLAPGTHTLECPAE
jgi:alpha-L-rhamnosidase